MRESYIQCFLFLCVTILVALLKRTFSLTFILWQRIILCSKFVVDFLGCAQRFNNILNTVMMQTVVRKSTYHTKPHSISQINVTDYIQEINIYIYWYEYDNYAVLRSINIIMLPEKLLTKFILLLLLFQWNSVGAVVIAMSPPIWALTGSICPVSLLQETFSLSTLILPFLKNSKNSNF